MKRFKERWDIRSNWQFIFPFLGIVSLIFSSILIVYKAFNSFVADASLLIAVLLYFILGIPVFYALLKVTLWLFKKLENKWIVKYRWEMIAIFLVFAITGSASARVSGPLLHYFGFERAVFSSEWFWGVLYWFIRILIIFPIYQILLIVIGSIFGQYKFFRNFEEKMLSRMGLSFLFSSK